MKKYFPIIYSVQFLCRSWLSTSASTWQPIWSCSRASWSSDSAGLLRSCKKSYLRLALRALIFIRSHRMPSNMCCFIFLAVTPVKSGLFNLNLFNSGAKITPDNYKLTQNFYLLYYWAFTRKWDKLWNIVFLLNVLILDVWWFQIVLWSILYKICIYGCIWYPFTYLKKDKPIEVRKNA